VIYFAGTCATGTLDLASLTLPHNDLAEVAPQAPSAEEVPAFLQETHEVNRHPRLIADLAGESLLIMGDKGAPRLREPEKPGEAV
jgi:hypothetical protein